MTASFLYGIAGTAILAALIVGIPGWLTNRADTVSRHTFRLWFWLLAAASALAQVAGDADQHRWGWLAVSSYLTISFTWSADRKWHQVEALREIERRKDHFAANKRSGQ